MRLLYPIVGVPISDMDCFRDYLTMGDWITSQLIRHDLPELSAMISQQTLEKPLCCRSVPPGMQINIYHFAILVNSCPQVMLLAVNLHEEFINEESIAVALVLPLQSARIDSPEFYTPEADRFAADSNASFGW